MGGDAPPRPVADGFLRFLIPAPKPRPAAEPTAPARLVPPHRLVAPPPAIPVLRPEERLHIVPPTRPDWLPPPAPRPPPPPPRSHAPPAGAGVRPTRPFPQAFDEPRPRNAGRFGGNVNGARGRSLGAFPRNNGGRSGSHKPKAAAVAAVRKEKKAWVAVEKKGEDAGDEGQAAMSEGYSGGDEAGTEAEDQLEPEGEHDTGGHSHGLDHEDDAKDSLVMPYNQECSDGGDVGRTSEQVMSQSNQVQHQRGRTSRWQVECRHDIDTFTPGFLAMYESLKPSEEHKTKQQQLVDSLTKSVSKEWPDARLHLYGSSANSFGTSHSDVDVCLEMEIGTESTVEILLKLADVLRTDSFDNVEAITGARVPIVRMSDPESGFSCDICINNLLAVANTKLLKDYAQIDQRLLQLAFLVKHWAKLRGVNETYRGTLSSYAYVLMCIHFLQLREPKSLPCLQAMEHTYTMNVHGTECAYFDKVHQLQDFGAENKESIAELLWAFFHYWAFHHNYKRDVISVRIGNTISRKQKNWTARIGNDRHLMCIEDPFETDHDLGRGVDRQTIRILREEFERAATMLQYDDDPCVTLFEPYDYEN
ncbi:hypothetical protein HU200_043732 [Digitaria exilis]|uniref:RNA uridylyltransferase n=1 Tax=Digitaria exilis TaxID=1010633 RepID=A0A835B580_9POAL|nr:hypothetical protein HU200_043732 [Digitaria exilis]